MKQLYICFMGIWVALFSSHISARPVSYPDGWTFMTNHDAFESNLHLHYTPDIDYSVGYKGIYDHENGTQFHGAQLNYLLWRINTRTSQANFYLKSAVGIHHNNHTAAAGFVGFAADWEDRDYFVMYENRLSDSAQTDRDFMQKARIGISPYVGKYGDLHTWAMLEVSHRPNAVEDADKVTWTPMLRFFKDVYLAEIGMTDRKKIMFNLIIRH